MRLERRFQGPRVPRCPVWTLKGWGRSRPLRAGKGHDCAYFRKMTLTVVWRVNRKGRDWMSGSGSEFVPPVG